ncbi:Ubiquinone/menaquinone biosynthesis C-methylase UbiE [Candidatus Methanophagaceae archaeon]|nr:Ubiquinone/menaquinone biosynthesis C-methylase UbiE [Methanophagales archaeon]
MLDKFVDRTARKPSGWFGKRMYSNPRGHYKSFRWTLDKLQLKPDDILLEIGCSGGVLLNMALETVKHAKAIDHSSDMVRLAREKNQEAISEGRVEIVQGNAESLPWDDNSFTCATANQMFFFIDKPLVVLKDFYRVLKPGGRLVITSTEDSILPKLLFVLWYHSMHLYKNQEMEYMLKQVGFQTVEVTNLERFIQLSYAEK